MYLSGTQYAPYLMIEPDSDLNNIKPEYLENKYMVRLYGEFNNDFLIKFSEKFKDVEKLDIGNKFGGFKDNSFVYKLPNLKGLVISLFKDSDFVLDCAKLPRDFESLNINVWTKKLIKNIESLNNTNIKSLFISDYTSINLTPFKDLTNLEYLSITRAKIKSLKGIENLTNLKVLSLGAVRSLTDISDIKYLKNLKYLEFDICWKLKDFSPVADLKKLEVLKLLDCKNLSNIQFVKQMPDLKQLSALGTTVINDFDTTPAEHLPVFFHNGNKKYNKQYPEKAIKEKVMGTSRFLKDE